jgi:transposase InsO family protein
VPPLGSPKLFGHVERAHRTDNEEFYEVTPDPWTLPELNRQLRAWEHTYNTVRSHQALGYATPLEFVRRWNKSKPNAH